MAQIQSKAVDMKPQELSNCLLACAQLEKEVPKVLDIVPVIVGETCVKFQNMKPQELSNSLEALVLLRDSGPEIAAFLSAGGSMDDILTSAAKRLNILLPNLREGLEHGSVCDDLGLRQSCSLRWRVAQFGCSAPWVQQHAVIHAGLQSMCLVLVVSSARHRR